MVDKNTTLRKIEDDQAQEDDTVSQLSQVSDIWETSGVRMSAVCLNVLQDISDAASQYSSLDQQTADRTKKTDQEQKKKSFVDFFKIKRKKKSRKKSDDEGKAQIGQSAFIPSNADKKKRNEKLDNMPEARLEHEFDHGEKHFDISSDKSATLPSKKESTDVSKNQKGNTISASEAIKSKKYVKEKQNTLPKVEPKEQKGNRLQWPWKRLETSIQKMITNVNQKFPTSDEPAVGRRKDDSDVRIPIIRANGSESDNKEFNSAKDDTFDTTGSAKREHLIKKSDIHEIQQTPLDTKSSITFQESPNFGSRGRPQKRSIDNYRRGESAGAPTTRGPKRKIRRRALSREWVVIKTTTTEYTTTFSPDKSEHRRAKTPEEKAISSPLLDGTNGFIVPETGTSNKTPSARKEKASELRTDDKHLKDLISSKVNNNNNKFNQASPRGLLQSLPSIKSPQTDIDKGTLHAPNASHFNPESLPKSNNLPNINLLLTAKNNPVHFASASKTELQHSSEPELEFNSIPSAFFKEETGIKLLFPAELNESPHSNNLTTSIASKHITSLSSTNPNHFYQETSNKEPVNLNSCSSVNETQEPYTSSMSDVSYNGRLIPNRIWRDADQKQAFEVTDELKCLERNTISYEASKPRWTKRKHAIRSRAGNLSLTSDSNDSTNETTPELGNLPQSFYDRDWPGESGQPKIERNRVRLHSPKLNRRGSFSPRLSRHGSSSPRISRTSSSPRTKRTSFSPKPARPGTSPRQNKPRWTARKPAIRVDRQSTATISSADHSFGAILKLTEGGNDDSSFYQGGIWNQNVGDRHIDIWEENCNASKPRWTKRKPATRGKTRELVGVNSPMMQMYDSSSDTSTNAPEFRDHKVREDLKKTYKSDDSSVVDSEDPGKNQEFYGSSISSFGIEAATNALGQDETQAIKTNWIERNRPSSVVDARNKNESALSDQICSRGELSFDKNRNISQSYKNNVTDDWSGLQSLDAITAKSSSEGEGILFWDKRVNGQTSVLSQGYFNQVSCNAAAAFDANPDGNGNSFLWSDQINYEPSDCNTISNKDKISGHGDHQDNDESSCCDGNQDGFDVEYFADVDAKEGPTFPDCTEEIPFARTRIGYSNANEETTPIDRAIKVVQPSDRTWSFYSTARDNSESYRKFGTTKPNFNKVIPELPNESTERNTKPNTSENFKPTKQSDISLLKSTNIEQCKQDVVEANMEVKDQELQGKEEKLALSVRVSTGYSGKSEQGQGYPIHSYLGDYVLQIREKNVEVKIVPEADNGLLNVNDRAKSGYKNDELSPLLTHESNQNETQVGEDFVKPAITEDEKSYSTNNSNIEEFYFRQKDLLENINIKSIDLSEFVSVYQSNTIGFTCSIEDDTKIKGSPHSPEQESLMTETKQQTVHGQESSTDQSDATSHSIHQGTILLPTGSKSFESRSWIRSVTNKRVLSDEDRSSPMLTTRRFHVDLPYSDSGYSETEVETLSPCSFRSSISRAETVTEEVYSESLTDDESRFSFSLADDANDKTLLTSTSGFDPQNNAYIVQDSIMPFEYDKKISRSQDVLQDTGGLQVCKSNSNTDSPDTKGEDIATRLPKHNELERGRSSEVTKICPVSYLSHDSGIGSSVVKAECSDLPECIWSLPEGKVFDPSKSNSTYSFEEIPKSTASQFGDSEINSKNGVSRSIAYELTSTADKNTEAAQIGNEYNIWLERKSSEVNKFNKSPMANNSIEIGISGLPNADTIIYKDSVKEIPKINTERGNQPREVDSVVCSDESVPHLSVFQSKHTDLNDFKTDARESEEELGDTISQQKIEIRKLGQTINDDKASVDVKAGLPKDAFATKGLEDEVLNRVYRLDDMATEIDLPDNCGKPLTDSELFSPKFNAFIEDGFLAQKKGSETSGRFHQLRCVTIDSVSSVNSDDDRLDTAVTSSQSIGEREPNIQNKGRIFNGVELQEGGFNEAEIGEELSISRASKTVCDISAFPSEHLDESSLRVDDGRTLKIANEKKCETRGKLSRKVIIPDYADKTLKDFGRHFTRSTFLTSEEQTGFQRKDLQEGITDFEGESISYAEHFVIDGGNFHAINCRNVPKEDRICYQQGSKMKSESNLESISCTRELEADLELLTWYEYAELYSVYRQFPNGSNDSLLPSTWIWNSSRYATNYRLNAKQRTALHYPEPRQYRSYSCPLVSDVFVLVRERKASLHHKSISMLERRSKADSDGHSVVMKNSAHDDLSMTTTQSYELHDVPKAPVAETIQKMNDSKHMAEQSPISATSDKENSAETKFEGSVVQQRNRWTKTEISSDVVPLSRPSDNLSINSSAAEHDDNYHDILKEKECFESTTLIVDKKNSHAKSNPTSKGKSKRKRKTGKKESHRPVNDLKDETYQSPEKKADEHKKSMSDVICGETAELSGTECSVIQDTKVSSLEHCELKRQCPEANISNKNGRRSILSDISAASSSSLKPQGNVEAKESCFKKEVSSRQIDSKELSQVKLSEHEKVENKSGSEGSSAETDSASIGVGPSDDTTDLISESGKLFERNLRQRSRHNEADNEDGIADNVASVEATSPDVVGSEPIRSNRNKAAIIQLLAASAAGLVSLILLLYITIHDSKHE